MTTSSEGPELAQETLGNSIRYRVVQTHYTFQINYGYSGEGPNEPLEESTEEVVLSGSGNIDKLDEETLGLSEDRFPTQDYEDGSGPAVGSGQGDYSYKLEVEKDGNWHFAKHLTPYKKETKPED